MVMMMMNNDDDYGGEGDGDGDDNDEDDYGGDVAHCCAIFLGHLSMKIYLYIDDRQIQILKTDNLVGQSTSGDDDENLYTPPLAPTRQTLGSSREVAKDPANTFPVSIVIIIAYIQKAKSLIQPRIKCDISMCLSNDWKHIDSDVSKHSGNLKRSLFGGKSNILAEFKL